RKADPAYPRRRGGGIPAAKDPRPPAAAGGTPRRRSPGAIDDRGTARGTARGSAPGGSAGRPANYTPGRRGSARRELPDTRGGRPAAGTRRGRLAHHAPGPTRKPRRPRRHSTSLVGSWDRSFAGILVNQGLEPRPKTLQDPLDRALGSHDRRVHLNL